MSLFHAGLIQATDNNGDPASGAKWWFYLTGTSTATNVYSNATLATSLGASVTADSAGWFVPIYLDDAISYRAVLKTAAGATIGGHDIDPVSSAAPALYARTAAEISAGVTPTSYSREPGDRRRYATLADAVAVSASHPLTIYDSEAISAAVTLPAGADIRGFNSPLITVSVNGVHAFNATSVATITIKGIRFKGSSASTVPLTGYGGYAAANTGLITVTSCTDVRVEDCGFDTFYNGLTAQNCDRVWLNGNRVLTFTFCGILASESTQFQIDRNRVSDCVQAGAVVAYGITATGDEAGADTQQQCSISFNTISDIASWDGIMTHDVTGLSVIGNNITNVRGGIDIGHLVATNRIRNIIVADNYIKSTTTDTWAAAANAGGILIAGFDATDRLLGAVVANNIVDSFFTGAMTGGGNPSHIVIANVDDCTVTGNVVKLGGATISNAGIRVSGTCNRLAVTGNSLQGAMAQGGIRLATVTSDGVAITGNVIKQTTSTVEAVVASAGTITALAMAGNSTNSTVPWSNAAATVTFAGMELEGSATYDPPSPMGPGRQRP